MKLDGRVLFSGAIGATISVITLVAMAFINLPAGLEYPGVTVLTGEKVLSVPEQQSFLSGMRMIFLLDGVFLTGWLVSWSALSTLVFNRNSLFGMVTLLLGIAGAVFDFGENSIILGILQLLHIEQVPGEGWMITWKAVQHMSYWLPFAGAVFAGVGLWSHSMLDRLTALVGILLIPLAGMGLYFEELALASNIWFLLWFASVALLLWRRSKDLKNHR